MKFLTPLILIGLSVAAFFFYINPTYTNIGALRKDNAQYKEALANAQVAQEHWNQLRSRYDSLTGDQLIRLKKFMPDKVDTIKLAVDLNAVAEKYGKGVRNIKFADALEPAGDVGSGGKPYGTTAVSYDVTMTYDNFLRYLKDLEQSLQFIDITNIGFQPASTADATYNFTLTLKTYWLK